MDKMDNKQEIIETSFPYVVVNSAAGSGKTTVLTERVIYLLKQNKQNIVVLTFTNAAAAEMKQRIEQKGVSLKNTFIGTIHSYANYLLLCSGYSTKKIIEDERFDDLFNKIKSHPNCIQKVDYLLLDEAQDSTDLQFEFILESIKPSSFFFVGDIRQSIYGFLQASPTTLIHLMSQNDVKVYNLNVNYRCKEKILSFAKKIINQLDYKYYDSSIASQQGGELYFIEFTPEQILQTISSSNDNFKDWFVLVRTNNEVERISQYLKYHNIPCDTFKKSELDNNTLEEKMKENTVKVLTIHSSKGLENKNVIVGSFPMYKPEEIRVGYVAATRASERLYWFKPKSKSRRKKKIENWEN